MRIITKRKIGYLLLLIFALIFSIARIQQVRDTLKRKVIEDIYRNSKGTILIQASDLKLGLGYISIDSVQIRDKGKASQYDLGIAEARIYYRLWPLLFFRNSLSDYIKRVELTDFYVRFHSVPSGREARPDTINSGLKLKEFLTTVEHVPDIVIRNGRFQVSRDRKIIAEVEQLDGVLRKTSHNDVHLNLTKKTADSGLAVLNLHYIIPEGILKNTFYFQNFPVTTIFFHEQNSGNHIESGLLDGEISAVHPVDDLKRIHWEGSLWLKNVSGYAMDKFFHAESLIMEGKANALSVRGESVLFGSNDIQLYGEVTFDQQIRMNGFFSAYGFDLSSLNYYLGQDSLIGGVAKVLGTFSYDRQFSMKTSFISDRMWIKETEFENLMGECILIDTTGTIRLAGGNTNFYLQSHVKLHMRRLTYSGNVELDIFTGDRLPVWIEQWENTHFTTHLDFRGNLKTGEFASGIQGTITEGIFPLPFLKGEISYRNQLLQFILKDSSGREGMEISVQSKWSGGQPESIQASISSVPVVYLLNPQFPSGKLKNLRASFTASGSLEKIRGNVVIFDAVRQKKWAEFNGQASNLFSGNSDIEGNFLFSIQEKEHLGRYYIASRGENWNGFFYLGDEINIRLGLSRTEGGPRIVVSGTVDQLNLASYTFATSPLQWGGTIQADFQYEWTNTTHSGQFSLEGKDIIVNGVGYFHFLTGGEVTQNRLVLSRLQGELNNVPVMQGEAEWNLDHQTGLINLHGNHLNFYHLAELANLDRDLVRGNLTYQLHIKKEKGSSFSTSMVIFSPEIKLKREKWRDVRLELQDELGAGSILDKKNHLIKLTNFSYVSDRGYTLSAEGVLPGDPQKDMDLHVKMQGNILTHLTDWLSYFTRVKVDGNLLAHLNGRWSKPVLNSLELSISDGEMEFARVLKPLHRIKATIRKEENNPFIHIENLEGMFENAWARVTNREEVRLTDGRWLKPWYFEDVDANLGILVLETDPAGIPLNIPGLQEEGDFGYFAVTGMAGDEDFYFAGPPERPYVRGMVYSRNARMTFPFIGMEDETAEPGVVVQFLMGIEWDVLARPRTGTYYFVDIPAYVGKVYMELNVDLNSPGLHFKGAINDESFRVSGEAFSYKGTVEYLETSFKVDKFGAVFNEYELFPEVYGRAYTTIRDSLNIPHEIYLQLYAIDPDTKMEVQRGRWEDFRFKLVSNEPVIGDNQELVLAQMGYSLNNIPNKISEVGTQLTENLLIRPLVRPLERFLEKKLKLDYVRFRSSLAKNFLNMSLGSQFRWWSRESALNFQNPALISDPTLILLQSSELTMGKFLQRNLYLSYTAQLMSVYESVDLQVNQRFGLEYRLFKNFLLEMEYDYFKYSPYRYLNYNKNYDFIIRFRHSFYF